MPSFPHLTVHSGLSRIAACLGKINVGYSVPVYSAYENTLGAFNSFVSIPNQTDEAHGYRVTPEKIDKEVKDRGLSCWLMSNPNNPTGTMMRGEELQRLVEVFRGRGATLIADEFYSWYDHEGPLGGAISAAEYVEDPNEDPIVLIDGLTKNWRCPVSRHNGLPLETLSLNASSRPSSRSPAGLAHLLGRRSQGARERPGCRRFVE